jgi:polyisoprenoid-binding protein YceI
MASARWLLLVSLTTTGCVLGVPTAALPRAGVEVRPGLVLPPQEVRAAPAEAAHFAIRPDGSSIEVDARDLVVGAIHMTFDRYRGSLAMEESGGAGRLRLDVDMRSVRTD